jgi:hypothetical protein
MGVAGRGSLASPYKEGFVYCRRCTMYYPDKQGVYFCQCCGMKLRRKPKDMKRALGFK